MRRRRAVEDEPGVDYWAVRHHFYLEGDLKILKEWRVISSGVEES
jgi:hypothetical protein